MKFKSAFLIVCQTLASIGFGLGVMSVGIMQVDGGSQVLARLYEASTVPYMQIFAMLIICTMGTLGITAGNIMSTEMKTETKTEDG